MNKVYVDFHVLQSVPPSCINRDDTGSPKTAVYGGARRARVSSQAWKHAMRLMFRGYFAEAELGTRTKRIIDMVAGEIRAIDPAKKEDEAKELAKAVIECAGVTTANEQAKALFFMSKKQAQNLAKLILNTPEIKSSDKKKKNKEDSKLKKEAQTALNAGHGVDVALFGRMVADDPSLNADAAAQVAHSISTHKVENEYDYYTALDDLSPEDSAGAGMIGTVEYNSATLYRYATVALHGLASQLSDDEDAPAKTLKEFARAFITSMPTGKQNTFANRTLPDAVLITVRADQPVNLVGAFETPVRGEGFVQKSAEALTSYAQTVYKDFCGEPVKSYIIGALPAELGEKLTLAQLLERLGPEAVAVYQKGGDKA
jgi:CRISPR system Cascade subunit CasC